jgi:hypothetical protein
MGWDVRQVDMSCPASVPCSDEADNRSFWEAAHDISSSVINDFVLLLLIVFLLRQKPQAQLQYRVPPKKR